MSELLEQPPEIIEHILSYIEHPMYPSLLLADPCDRYEKYKTKYWFSTMLTCKLLLLIGRRVFDPSKYNNLAIQHAAYHGYTESVKMLLQDERVDPTVLNNSPIGYASKYGHVEVVKLLLADPRVILSEDSFALCSAAQNGHTKVVRLLLEHPNININYILYEGLYAAIVNNHTDTALLLLRNPRIEHVFNVYGNWMLKEYRCVSWLKKHWYRPEGGTKYPTGGRYEVSTVGR